MFCVLVPCPVLFLLLEKDEVLCCEAFLANTGGASRRGYGGNINRCMWFSMSAILGIEYSASARPPGLWPAAAVDVSRNLG